MKQHRFAQLKGFLAGVVLTLTLLLGVPALADQIEVVFNRVNITLEGQSMVAAGHSYTLDDGTVVPYSILYEGTTYLPLRRIGEIFDKEVEWDSTTNTVNITEKLVITPLNVDGVALDNNTDHSQNSGDHSGSNNSNSSYNDTPSYTPNADTYTVEELVASLYGYPDYPEVPDFGEFSGATMYTYEQLDNGISYLYDLDFTSSQMADYLDALVTLGYELYHSTSDASGETYVFYGIDNNFQVTVSLRSDYMSVRIVQ